MFPGDPSGSGWNIYDCRCTMIAKVKGVDMSNSLRRDRYGLLPNMTYAQWENTQRGEGALAAERYARKEAERETKDRKQYEEYKNILGENAPKSFTEFQNLKYNDNKWELFKAYERAIQTGELTTLTDFTLYQETSKEIDDKLVGLTTSNGITITGKSNHFIARVIGSVEQRRSGVDVDRVLEALTSKDAKILPTRVSPNGKISQRFIYEDIELSINPETGSLIQVNPYSRGRKS